MSKTTEAKIIAKEWLSDEEAAKKLGRSVRTVQRLASAGLVRTQEETREGQKPRRLYSDADLDNVKEQGIRAPAKASGNGTLVYDTTRHHAEPPPLPPGETPTSPRWLSAPAASEQLPAASHMMSEMAHAMRLALTPIGGQPSINTSIAPGFAWVTLAEAAAISRFSMGFLKRLIDEKKLVAVKAPQWLIKRTSLEAFEG